MVRLAPDLGRLEAGRLRGGLGRHGLPGQRLVARHEVRGPSRDASPPDCPSRRGPFADRTISIRLVGRPFPLAGALAAGVWSSSVPTLPRITSFHCPTRIAPLAGAALSRISSCGDGLPSAIVGQASRPSSGSFCSSDAPASFKQRGIPVDHVQRLVDDGARLDVARPGGEGRDAHAALVERALAGPERAVAGDAARARPAVVAGEDDQRVRAASPSRPARPRSRPIASSIAATMPA